MHRNARFFLLGASVLYGGFVFFVGSGFARSTERLFYEASRDFYWAGVALLATAPMWLPTLVPSTFPRLLRVCRLICALLLLVPTLFAGSIVAHNFSLYRGGQDVQISVVLMGILLTVTCVACLVVLVWHQFKRK